MNTGRAVIACLLLSLPLGAVAAGQAAKAAPARQQAEAARAKLDASRGQAAAEDKNVKLSLIHISEPTRPSHISRMPSSA